MKLIFFDCFQGEYIKYRVNMVDIIKDRTIETPASYAKNFLEVKRLAHQLKSINIAFLSSYTSEVLNPYIAVELSRYGYFTKNYFAPFNQFEQEILNQESNLYGKNPDVVIIHNMMEDMYPDMVSNFSKYSNSKLDIIACQVINRYKAILETLRGNIKASIIIVNFSMLNSDEESSIYSTIKQRKVQYIHKINQELLLLCNGISDCYTINYISVVLKLGLKEWIDRKLYLMARIPFSGQGQMEFGKVLAKTVYSIDNHPCKCLVLDLDNTLWGGVIGEDGIGGIEISENYPGNVFKDFQRAILNLRNQGVLLAIASKNNFDDAIKVFRKHPDCLIKESDFVAMEINWNDKATNIQKIAAELNIGLDSVVFFDDNPTERQWVSDKLPSVKVIDTPDSPMMYTQALHECNYFNFFSTTVEDKGRNEMIHQSQKRENLGANSKDLDDFLMSLDMTVSIKLSNQDALERVSQLTNKTNQFNLTTKRYSTTEINNFIELGHLVLHLSVEDCFGSYGISGVAIIKQQDKFSWKIDTFLLSCRIIGKKIESVFLSEIINFVKDKGASVLLGQYIDSKKNSLTVDFYKNHNFLLLDNDSNTWKYDLRLKPKIIDFIKIKRT